MAKSTLNKVILIGNLTSDPIFKDLASGGKLCYFTVATDREHVTASGEKRQTTEFTRVSTWNKLAEICQQLLNQGDKVYIEGRLHSKVVRDDDGNDRTLTEVVCDDMRLLFKVRDKYEASQI